MPHTHDQVKTNQVGIYNERYHYSLACAKCGASPVIAEYRYGRFQSYRCTHCSLITWREHLEDRFLPNITEQIRAGRTLPLAA